MMRNVASIEIDQPIEEVFRLTNDHVADWSIIVVEDEVIDEKPEGVGTTFRTVTEDHGKRMAFQGVVTRHDPPYLNAIQLTGTTFDIETEFTFEDLSGRTRVTQTTSVTGKGLFKLFMLIFGWMMNKSHCKASQNELESLKRYSEGHSDPASTWLHGIAIAAYQMLEYAVRHCRLTRSNWAIELGDRRLLTCADKLGDSRLSDKKCFPCRELSPSVY